MTEPNGPEPAPAARPADGDPGAGPRDGTAAGTSTTDPFADLEQRPVTEHVAVFEEEHQRLQRELGTIDQL